MDGEYQAGYGFSAEEQSDVQLLHVHAWGPLLAGRQGNGAAFPGCGRELWEILVALSLVFSYLVLLGRWSRLCEKKSTLISDLSLTQMIAYKPVGVLDINIGTLNIRFPKACSLDS